MSIIDRAIALASSEEETYRVPLATGDEVEFRHIKGIDELSKLERGAAEQVEAVKAGRSSKEIKATGVKDPVTIMQAHFLRTLYVGSWRCVESEDGGTPSFEPESEAPSLVSWLDMAAKVPFVFRTLWARVDDEVTGRATIARRQAIDAAKKESSETTITSPSSEPAVSAGANTHAS